LAGESLRLEGVDSYYGDSHVLHDVGFGVPERGLLALLGRNGAGKTTCLGSIIGFVPPARGSILLFGEAIERRPPEAVARRGVGLVPQGRRIFRSLTVKENLAVAARRGAAENGDGGWTLDRVFELFPRLGERQNQTAGLLSGGEQQMLAFGRALVGNPRVLLLDEPSEGLAPQIVEEVAAALRRLKESGLSILLVEQNTKLALGLADRVVVLNTGRVVYDGPADAIKDDDAFLSQHLGVY
jgi:branched-chain amino acid transport system ATP-binding protein